MVSIKSTNSTQFTNATTRVIIDRTELVSRGKLDTESPSFDYAAVDMLSNAENSCKERCFFVCAVFAYLMKTI